MADAPIPPQDREQSENLFDRTNKEIQKLQESIDSPSSSTIYRNTCQSILDSLIAIRNDIQRTSAYSPDVVQSILERKRWEVSSGLSLKEVAKLVPKEILKTQVWPSYTEKQYVKGYQVTKCQDPAISALIYPRFLAAHGRYPNNDQIPLYFAQQIYAEVRLGK